MKRNETKRDEHTISPVDEHAYYETDAQLAQYLEFYFGQPYITEELFPLAFVRHSLAALDANVGRRRKALDLGCAVGRAAFELCKIFDQVLAVDYSTRFIQYTVQDEGDLVSARAVTVADDLRLTPEQVARVSFVQGDACNLKTSYTDFDLIIAANLIDRLYDPADFLRHIHERLLSGGILAISSPYTWLEEHPEKSKWLGGFNLDGKPVNTLATLRTLLALNFELVGDPRDVEFVIRETRRKLQHTFSKLTLWRRNRK